MNCQQSFKMTRFRVKASDLLIKRPPALVKFIQLSLDLSHATFVSPIALTRGTRVRLNLGSLPDYPRETWVDASVASLGQMGGESFLIKARLPALKLEQRQPLMKYLEALGGQTRLSHA